MKQFMNRYFSIAFMFVVAASFVACNYSPKDDKSECCGEGDTTQVNTLEFTAPDSTASLPFEIDSITTVSQLLDSLAAVEVVQD
jgi:hypothetical protein